MLSGIKLKKGNNPEDNPKERFEKDNKSIQSKSFDYSRKVEKRRIRIFRN